MDKVSKMEQGFSITSGKNPLEFIESIFNEVLSNEEKQANNDNYEITEVIDADKMLEDFNILAILKAYKRELGSGDKHLDINYTTESTDPKNLLNWEEYFTDTIKGITKLRIHLRKKENLCNNALHLLKRHTQINTIKTDENKKKD